MGLIIHNEKIDGSVAAKLIDICPFKALSFENGKLSVNAACKACKLCVKKGPAGAITWEDEEKKETVDKSLWRGVCVFCEISDGKIHPVTLELLGKARELADSISHPVYGILIGKNVKDHAAELCHYGADKIFVYDDAAFEQFRISPYTAAFYDFIERIKPSSILVGATNMGRSLAPRVAARCGAGLTADCTVLKMKENTDLVQIRPAFGGNIMAQIVTPNARPQFCTVRYKIFSAPVRSDISSGEVVKMDITDDMRRSGTEILSVTEKPREIDISDADVIVACGRGFAKEADLEMARELAELLGGQLAGTRPLIEAGWLSPKRQIGLSGRTVKPKIIICLGISGSVQFAAGMKGADLIVAVNKAADASIFDICHVGLVGDIYEIVPQLIEKIKGGKANV
ncbi:MAG: electron transfer flavoprotein subunit alpha [Ruminococcaceae bacterium]|nr:electron transfer flavoprotein subunit alpha [Oscillospiraceae bacterium]